MIISFIDKKNVGGGKKKYLPRYKKGGKRLGLSVLPSGLPKGGLRHKTERSADLIGGNSYDC